MFCSYKHRTNTLQRIWFSYCLTLSQKVYREGGGKDDKMTTYVMSVLSYIVKAFQILHSRSRIPELIGGFRFQHFILYEPLNLKL